MHSHAERGNERIAALAGDLYQKMCSIFRHKSHYGPKKPGLRFEMTVAHKKTH